MLLHGTDRSANAAALNVVRGETRATLGSEETGLRASVHNPPHRAPRPLTTARSGSVANLVLRKPSDLGSSLEVL